MTLKDIIEQVKQLSPAERRELSQQLRAMEDGDWAEAELSELLTVEPMTGHEIVKAGLTGGWRDLEVEDDWIAQFQAAIIHHAEINEPPSIRREDWYGDDGR